MKRRSPCLGTTLRFSRPFLVAFLLMSKANGASGNSPSDSLVQQPSEERFLQVPTDRPVLPTPISRPGGTFDESPTASPTRRPTQAPTRSPITVPTSKPPTRAPTLAPTRVPIAAPIATPLAAPTTAPMVSPTPRPVAPIPDEPDQTIPWTLQPTLAPTRAPMVAQVAAPTPGPVANQVAPDQTIPRTLQPTLAPTQAPISAPVAAPTIAPMVAPTPIPVETPPAAPEQTPSRTLQPTRSPLDPSNNTTTISASGSSMNIAGALAGGFAAFLLTGVCLFFIQRRRKTSKTTSLPETKKPQKPYGARPSITSTPSKRSGRFMAELMLPPQEDISTLGDPTFTSARMLMAALENGEEHFKVIAPAGKLGMVLGTTIDGGMHIVHAIEATSPLADRVRVGDRLLSVDGEDCTGTAASLINAPELISRKSEKPSRILIFARSVESGGSAHSMITS